MVALTTSVLRLEKSRRTTKRLKENLVAYGFLAGGLICFGLFSWYPAIRALIRDDKIHQIYSMMQSGKKYGMQTMNDALYQLYMSKTVAFDDCLRASHDQPELMRMCGMTPEDMVRAYDTLVLADAHAYQGAGVRTSDETRDERPFEGHVRGVVVEDEPGGDAAGQRDPERQRVQLTIDKRDQCAAAPLDVAVWLCRCLSADRSTSSG